MEFMRNFLLILLTLQSSLFASEICSRVATVNYQEVLVDAGASARGEGLRFYLEKDQRAAALFREYQENASPDWKSTALSTLGGSMMIFGLTRTTDGGGLFTRNSLVLSGATVIALSYLITKTLQYNNEYKLQRAVEEYNKRNRPLIYFSPFVQDSTGSGNTGVGVGIQKGF